MTIEQREMLKEAGGRNEAEGKEKKRDRQCQSNRSDKMEQYKI